MAKVAEVADPRDGMGDRIGARRVAADDGIRRRRLDEAGDFRLRGWRMLVSFNKSRKELFQVAFEPSQL